MTYRIQLPDMTWCTAERVTEVIARGCPRPALDAWKLREAVRFALASPHSFGIGIDEAVDISLDSWEAASRVAARRGTAVHRCIAEIVRGHPAVPEPEHTGYLDAFARYSLDGLGLAGLVEQTLLAEDYLVAGTADLITEDGILIDWKTSATHTSGPAWPDQIAQIGAYAQMRWLVDDKRVIGDAPKIREGRIVRLCADGTWSHHVLSGPDLTDAKRLWAHVQGVARHVKGRPR